MLVFDNVTKALDVVVLGADGAELERVHQRNVAEGLLEAGNRQEAMRQVQLRGLRPVRLSESAAAGKASPAKSEKPAVSFSFGQPRKITPRMLENFTRLLSSLLAAGVPFSRALVILHREAAEPVAKDKWKEIHDLVIDGMSLSAAMARSPAAIRTARSAATAACFSGSLPLFAWLQSTISCGGS